MAEVCCQLADDAFPRVSRLRSEPPFRSPRLEERGHAGNFTSPCGSLDPVPLWKGFQKSIWAVIASTSIYERARELGGISEYRFIQPLSAFVIYHKPFTIQQIINQWPDHFRNAALVVSIP